jgi:hypothetical protein
MNGGAIIDNFSSDVKNIHDEAIID